MPNYPDRTPRDEHEAHARARSPEIELSILLEFHGLEEYGPYISIEDADDGPSYRIESDDDQQNYMGSAWLPQVYPRTYWRATIWGSALGEKAPFHEINFDTRQNALLYIIEKLKGYGFVPHCEWTEWKTTGEGVEERECLLCPKVEVRYLEDLET